MYTGGFDPLSADNFVKTSHLIVDDSHVESLGIQINMLDRGAGLRD
jgi:hypothetical protein